MALSVVNFRMHHGNVFEQISFNGNGIKLLELKREVVERKKINKSLDFDLNVVDDNGKAYVNDDDFVPKNASVIVKRVPANAKTSLLSRLNNRGHVPHHAVAINTPSKSEIMMPMKEDDEEPEEDAPVPTTPSGEDLPFPMEEENVVLKRTIPLGLHGDHSVAPAAAPTQPMKGLSGIPKMPGVMYSCTRCNKTGHNAKYCPTIGDPNFDPNIQLQNIPRASRKKVITLDGIDTTNKTVVQNTDGTFEIFESSSAGLGKLGESTAIANIDMAEVPDHLKCALSNTLLREAVALPCCKKVVNDTVIRLELVNSGLKCPLCGAPGISPDWLNVRGDIRDMVDEFIKNYGKTPAPAAAAAAVAPAPVVPMYGLNPLLAAGGIRPPPPPGAPPSDPAGAAPLPYGVAPAASYPAYHYNSVPGAPPAAGAAPTAAPPIPSGAPLPPPPHMMLPPEIPPLEALPLPLPIDEFYRELEFQRQEKIYLEREFTKRYGSSEDRQYRGGRRDYDRSDRGGRGGNSDRHHGESSYSSGGGSASERSNTTGYYVSRHYKDSRNSAVSDDGDGKYDDRKHAEVSGSKKSSSSRDDKYHDDHHHRSSSSSYTAREERTDRHANSSSSGRGDRSKDRDHISSSTSRRRDEVEKDSSSRSRDKSRDQESDIRKSSRRDRSASGEDRKRSSSTRDRETTATEGDRKSSRRENSRSPERRGSSHREESSSSKRATDETSSDRHKKSSTTSGRDKDDRKDDRREDRKDRDSEGRRGDRPSEKSGREARKEQEGDKPSSGRSDREKDRERERERDRRGGDEDRDRRSEKRDGASREDRNKLENDEHSKRRRVVESSSGAVTATDSGTSGRESSGRDKDRERDKERGKEENGRHKRSSGGESSESAAVSSSNGREEKFKPLSTGRAVKSPVTTPEQTHRKGSKRDAPAIRYL